MADEIDEQVPRGVTVSRRHGAPPWQVDAGELPSLHVVVEGFFRLVHGEQRVLELAPGDVVLVGAGPPGAAPREPRLRCLPPPPGARAPQAELLSARYAGVPAELPGSVVHLPAAEVRRSAGLSAIVNLLRAALADPGAGQEALARSLLPPLLAYTLHCHRRAHAGAGTVDRRIARALQLMQAKPTERWTVAALASAAGLSRAAFARRFLAEQGVPPLRHLTAVRMQRAARRLVESDDSLAAIAAEVGYDSEFAFSRAFKRHTGEAPGAFRRRCRVEGGSFGPPIVCAAA
ncbi:AraC-type DNA-binding protein [Nannocystis exedens]|uniref:AraC-type DNA-binding protein n=1 Tax=Nannocystis exedens TaxID=54 RepID=A0A1I2ISQ9_9BACT|nr:AraC family transcriptional regulator [Nannocystis exedens]PCC74954.1 AraC family transcriptional regulator [Nannocystis exedens]SFF44668.1 AraC-type DNA-binding protein [Nannocystis exedens]